MNTTIIIIVLLFLSLIILYNKYVYKKIEGAGFDYDPLIIPNNPFPIDEVQGRRLIRIIGIERNLKMDKYGRVEKITFKKPKPELGEKVCSRSKCPNWMTEVVCWQCT